MFGLIAKKDKAMEKGYQSYNILKNHIKYEMESRNETCYTPKEMLDLLYTSEEYKEFVIDSLVLKKLCDKITMIKLIVTLLCFGAIAAIFYFIGLNILGIILTVLVAAFMIIFFLLFKEGKSYKDYYIDTMTKILGMAVSEYSISKRNRKNKNVQSRYEVINKDYINRNIDMVYDKYQVDHNCSFESKYEIGEDFDLKLIDVVERTDSEGRTTRSEQTIFDGFSIVSRNKQPHNVLNGSVIKIRADHNLLSALTEDTVNSMIQSKREFSFNSEILNKHLDCKIRNTGLTADVDQKMFEVTKIITSAFEDRMIFLDERYNAFNMNIADNEFSFTANLKRGSFQKLQDGELFKFGSNYKDKNHNTDIFRDVNFEYDRLYPILERLFLRKYFRVIYNYQMDNSRFSEYEHNKVDLYENEIKEVMDMPWKEFSEINKDYVKDLKETIKERYNSISSSESNLTKLEDDSEYLNEIEKEKENV